MFAKKAKASARKEVVALAVNERNNNFAFKSTFNQIHLNLRFTKLTMNSNSSPFATKQGSTKQPGTVTVNGRGTPFGP